MRKKFDHFAIVCVFMALASLGAGCSSTPKATEPQEEKVSTIPWNTPQKWEKGSPLGGATY